MRFKLDRGAVTWVVPGLLAVMATAVVVLGTTQGAERAKAPEPSMAPVAPEPPTVKDTPANLQQVFSDETNAKEWYTAAARQADHEGYGYVAQMFRACARSEEAHADQHVHAIAWTGQEAKALLRRVDLGTTPQNLQGAIESETYEATQLYPALLAKAREDHQSAAVRSMTFALAAEREHVRLLNAALQSLDQRLTARTFFVCPTCGKTVETVSFKRCPNCFGGARKFVRVT